MSPGSVDPPVANYPLLDALRYRRSRRFGVGMEMKAGPLAYKSTAPPLRLSPTSTLFGPIWLKMGAGRH
jgi:hypothetical protein